MSNDTKKINNTRALAATIAWQVVDQGRSLDGALAKQIEQSGVTDQDRGFVQEMVYGVIRWYWQLDDIAGQLLQKPIRNKDRVIHFVLLGGLYQIIHLETADHAAVSESVKACAKLKRVWAKNMINGCLRNYLREPVKAKQKTNELAHPQWLAGEIKKSWAEQFEQILSANNERPPFCLRVNQRKISRDDYLAKLISCDIDAAADPYSDVGIRLMHSTPVAMLPEFFNGEVSVQDTAAQLACTILQPQRGETILDACAAPGGKTAHIIEATDNKATVHAVDITQERLSSLHETLERLDLTASSQAVDATQLSVGDEFVPQAGFDRILIDAPCSGVGVIRRHPDIKHHRQASDIEQLVEIQSNLLNHLWTLLKPKGRMLYMTCSILPEENEQQIERFLSKHSDVTVVPIKHPNGINLKHGVQTLPGVSDMDGFYYCTLERQASDQA